MGRVVATFLSLVALSLFVAGPASATDGPDTPRNVQELLDAFGVATTPADYVVVVDTSGSMETPPALYPPVVAAYKRFVSAIGPKDQLSVITFDSTPNIRFAGDVSTAAKRKQAQGILPARADGRGTDIGAALDSTIAQLERPSSTEVQTVIFLTDGQINAPGSPYSRTTNPGWAQLANRAKRLSNGHRLTVYGAGLGRNATDVGVLKTVFPQTQVVSLPANQLSSFFNEAVQSVRVQRLYTPVTNELQQGFVSVAAEGGELADPTSLTVRLRSSYPHLGARVVVKSVQVTDSAGRTLQTTLVGGPRTVELKPNGTSDPIHLRAVPKLPSGRTFGEETQSEHFQVGVTADITAEPAEVIGTSLGIKTPGRVVQADPVPAKRTVGIAWWWFFVALILLALLMLLLFWIYRRYLRTPPLPGGVMLPNGIFESFHGKATRMPNRDVGIPRTDGAVVEFVTKRGKFERRRGLSKRHPRVFVHKIDGSSRVSTMGVQRPLAAEEQLVHSDAVVVGRARLTFYSAKR